MKKVLEIYKGFDGVSQVVDVGGGLGTNLKLIVSKYPQIKANFHLPLVVKDAPNFPNAISESGKVILLESIVPELPMTDPVTATTPNSDLSLVHMLPWCKGENKERWQREAGFPTLKLVCRAYNYLVMELYKNVNSWLQKSPV
ncbi:O-methyltransferase domain - like 10 [Theobroma cacao]|nr:O-methyltransferase domain - like 10 [Theobroma cacao]